MKHIAIVDDDVYIGDMLQEVLERAGYAVSRAYSGSEAVLLAQSGRRPDLMLLDLMLPGASGGELIMLPGLSGREALPELRGIPVIVLSARGAVEDKVQLLLEGAADYVTKPFDTRELLARIAVQLRQPESAASPLLWYQDICLDTDLRTVSAGGEGVRLTRTECAILRLLMENPEQVVTRSRLLEDVSRDTPDCVESSLKVHMSNLRRKLRQAGARDCIQAVWGIGFRLCGES